jgi:predicted choloylglycine hydrolase
MFWAVITKSAVQLVRNYDYHQIFEEPFIGSWSEKVIATSDYLIGAIDGMNEDGHSSISYFWRQ